MLYIKEFGKIDFVFYLSIITLIILGLLLLSISLLSISLFQLNFGMVLIPSIYLLLIYYLTLKNNHFLYDKMRTKILNLLLVDKYLSKQYFINYFENEKVTLATINILLKENIILSDEEENPFYSINKELVK